MGRHFILFDAIARRGSHPGASNVVLILGVMWIGIPAQMSHINVNDPARSETFVVSYRCTSCGKVYLTATMDGHTPTDALKCCPNIYSSVSFYLGKASRLVGPRSENITGLDEIYTDDGKIDITGLEDAVFLPSGVFDGIYTVVNCSRHNKSFVLYTNASGNNDDNYLPEILPEHQNYISCGVKYGMAHAMGYCDYDGKHGNIRVENNEVVWYDEAFSSGGWKHLVGRIFNVWYDKINVPCIDKFLLTVDRKLAPLEKTVSDLERRVCLLESCE